MSNELLIKISSKAKEIKLEDGIKGFVRVNEVSKVIIDIDGKKQEVLLAGVKGE